MGNPVHGSVSDGPSAGVESHTVVQARRFSGPIPSPSDLAAYDVTLPGLAERLVRMAEEEQAQRLQSIRREEDRKDKEVNFAESAGKQFLDLQNRGWWAGVIMTAFCFLCAAFSAFLFKTHWAVVVAFLGVPAVSVITAFMPWLKRRGENLTESEKQAVDKSKSKE